MTKKAFLLFFLVAVLSGNTHAMKNPAAVYCEAMGYKYAVENEDAGQRGFCILPGDQKVDGWEFLQGKSASEFSYCRTLGLDMKTVNNPEVCITFLTQECAVCILDNGTEVEVTRLMDLSFTDSYCGDGICHFSEFYSTCPEDCPAGQQDGFCDEVIDGTCDPDCLDEADADCAGADRDKDGICNGPESTDYPNCHYNETDGTCEPNEELMAECSQLEDMPACESFRYCTWKNENCEPYYEKFEECPTEKTVDSCTAADHCLWIGLDCTLCDAGPDNCPSVYNPDQADSDRNGVGDRCDSGSDTTSSTTTTIPVSACPAEQLYGEKGKKTVSLKGFRDAFLSKSPEGRTLIRLYYQNQAALSRAMHSDEMFSIWMRDQIDRSLPLIEKIQRTANPSDEQTRVTLRAMLLIIEQNLQSDKAITVWTQKAAESIFLLIER